MGSFSSTTQDVESRSYTGETHEGHKSTDTPSGVLTSMRFELTGTQRSLLLEELHADRRALLVERRGTGLSAGREALLQDILAEIDLLELQERKENPPDLRTEIEALAREVLGLKHR